MKNLLLASVALLGMTGASLAADLPGRRSAPAPIYVAPAFTWTGFYVGANAGYSFGKFSGNGGRQFDDPDGFSGGGQIGYNYQINQVVLGLETDLQFSDLKSNRDSTFGFGGVGRAKVEYFGTVRGRVGYAFDRFLPYLTGGFAYGQTKVDGLNGFGRSNDDISYGYALGAGVEYAFTQNLSAKLEYLYVDLEGQNSRNFGFNNKVGAEFSTVRAGINYRF